MHLDLGSSPKIGALPKIKAINRFCLNILQCNFNQLTLFDLITKHNIQMNKITVYIL